MDSNSNYPIKDFYKDASIFVTGGSGFLGKVVIEKLLRTCDSIRSVYVLLRPKKGVSTKNRITKLLQSTAFDRIRNDPGNTISKLIWINGDVTLPSLGLKNSDRTKLIENVNIVFHCAASVRFDMSLKDAANLNSHGTKRLYDICCQMKHLKSIVHVSTSYCQPYKEYVEEKVYRPEVNLDIETFMECVNTLPAKMSDSIATYLEGPHANTYTMTKAIGEKIAEDYSKKLPICIVRPSIISNSLTEPYPGWIENLNGITGFMMEMGRGSLTTLLCNGTYIMDVIPVDIVSNVIITAAWYCEVKQSMKMRVFNCISGQLNPVRSNDLRDAAVKHSLEYPSKYIVLYPNCTLRTNVFIHSIVEVVYQYFPAIVYDLYRKCKGEQPILFGLAKKCSAAAKTSEIFMLKEWIYETKNMLQLVNAVRRASDGKEFNVDIRTLNWNDYLKQVVLGIRQYLLKDGMDSLDRARNTLRKLWWSKIAFHLFQYSMMFLMLRKLYSRHGQYFVQKMSELIKYFRIVFNCITL